jgi:hypothetical protein
MKASFSSPAKIKLFSSVDTRNFITLLFITTIVISASYFLKPKDKKLQ